MGSATVEIAHRKLYRAVMEMACSESPRRERLEQAVTSQVHQVFLLLDDPGELPSEIVTRVTGLLIRLTEKGLYSATIHAMTDAEADFIIRELVSLYDMLARALKQDEAEPQEGS